MSPANRSLAALCVTTMSLGMLSVQIGRAEDLPVFNTGVDVSGQLLAVGELDSHWTIVSAPAGGISTPFIPIVTSINPAWQANGPNSNWISPGTSGFDNHLPGVYVYQTSFDLTGFDPDSAEFEINVAPDNDLVGATLNGIELGWTAAGFGFTTFALADFFQSGINTLAFRVDNTFAFPPQGANPEGFRAEFISANASLVPEPSSIALAAVCGLAGLALGWPRRYA